MESLRELLGALEFGVPAILEASACARGRFRFLEIFDGVLREKLSGYPLAMSLCVSVPV